VGIVRLDQGYKAGFCPLPLFSDLARTFEGIRQPRRTTEHLIWKNYERETCIVLTCVCASMPLEVERIIESLAAECADVALDVTVTLHVSVQ
jgi:hypothetical protein